MPGASGAIIEMCPERRRVRKTGPPGPVCRRLFDQYSWLSEHSYVGRLVKVTRRLPDGYEMELLYELTPDENQAFELADVMEMVWREAPEEGGDVFTHSRYVTERLARLPEELAKETTELFHQCVRHWDDLTWCLTHGDVTRLNMMRTDREWLTMIDPIPATPELPDIWAVDFGKLLVSALGYDEMFLGLPHDDRQAEGILDVVNGMREASQTLDIDASRYMAVLHIARMLPYHSEEQHDALIAIADRALRL